MKQILILSIQLFIILHISVFINCKQTPQSVIDKGFVETQSNNKIKIAFGSCNKFYRNQKADIFMNIKQQNPDIFAWLGDTAYQDTMFLPGRFVADGNIDSVTAKYRQTKQDKYYQQLWQQTPIVGIWDDHDYGLNNSGKDFIYKDQNQQLFLDFLDEPYDSPRRQQQGIYTSYYIGERKQVKLIMVDNRYFLDEEKGDILGQEQWYWLEQQFNDKNVELFILASGIQVIPDDRPPAENWFTESKDKLYSMIKKYSASVIFLSGDIHLAELLQHPCSYNLVGYQLHEITSSGLSLTFDGILPNINQFTNVVFSKTFSQRCDRYFAENYGVIDIEFEYDQNQQIDYENSYVTMSVYGKNNDINDEKYQDILVLQNKIRFQDLQQNEENLKKNEENCIINQQTKSERIKNNIINNLYEQIIENTNIYVIGIIFYYIITTLFLAWVYFTLLKVLFNQYELKENKQQSDKKKKIE